MHLDLRLTSALRSATWIVFAAAIAPVIVPGIMIGGCMSPRPAINRVQPDYLNKMDFIPNQYAALIAGGTPTTVSPTLLAKEPVFYTQNTLISKPTTIGFTGMTSYSEADKIRWEVDQNFLIARESYEYIKGTVTGAAGIGQNVQTGDPVAVFAITEHFDIKNEYNTTTGEELNVVDENTTDRPWYQRQYMHVDWSQNLITGYNQVLLEADFDGVLKSEPVAVYVNSPTDPNAPVFQWTGSDATRQLVYFDIVNKALLHPETTMLSYSDNPGSTTTQTFPVCYLSEDSQSCAPAEVTFRLSFRRTDPHRDYEPAPVNVPVQSMTSNLPNQGQFEHLDMERFGFFDQARVGYDPVQHATLDDTRMHFASRHNLWVHHHMMAWNTDSGTLCNVDADCSADGSVLCHIGNANADSTHRGLCSAPAIAPHQPNDVGCNTDDDCLQTINGTGQSATAFCDTSTNTCAENYIRCTQDTDCAKLDANSTCDIAIAYNRADNFGLCLMPFLQRQVRPVVYHESANYPVYMQPVTEAIVAEWNGAFTTAVTSARRHECELNKSIDPTMTALAQNPCNDPSITGLNPDMGADAQFVFVGCHSPVWGNDSTLPGYHSASDVAATNAKGFDLPSCGAQGTSARLGDLRYSMIGSITDQDQQGYWGLANIASDPETGEMVAGRGAVWQTVTDNYSAYLVTLVQLLTGVIQPTDVADGDYILNAQKQFGSGQTPSTEVLDAPLRQLGALQQLTQVKNGLSNLVIPGNGWFTPGSGLKLYSNDINNPGAMITAQNRILNGRILGDGTANGGARLMSLAGTPVESLLMNSQQNLLSTAGSSPDPTGALPATLNEASPMRMQSNQMRRVINGFKSRLSAYECDYDAMFEDDILLGLAERLAGGKPICGVAPTAGDNSGCTSVDPLDTPVSFGQNWNFAQGGAGGQPNWGLMQQYGAQFIHHGVLAHELGHSLGQRHNFDASADAINYNDQYWIVRSQGHPSGLAPRYQYVADPKDGQYYSQAEIDGRVDEWSYSSVMDYKGFNEDAHGIGRYDVAFIKNGYTNLVEAFKTVANMDKATTYSFNTAGVGFSTALDLTDFNSGGQAHGMHYTQIPAIFGTVTGSDGSTMVPNIGNDNRYDVFLRETCNGSASAQQCQPIAGLGDPAFSNVTNDGHLLVPYRFDTDERAGLVWQDQRYDAGPDAYESLHYVTSHILDYYFINSYARLRAGFSTTKYVSRIWSRYLDQLHQCTQTLAFDLINYQDFMGADSKNFLTYENDPTQFGGFVNQAAMSLSADTLTALLTMPEIGPHNPVAQFDGSKILAQIQSGQYIANIAINDGRAFESTWRNDVGFFWYDELDSAGAYYDKVMAIQALTDPDLLLLQRDTPTDIRLFELSYYTMFPDQMIRLFGGILSEDDRDFGPIYNQNSMAIQRTHVASLNLPAGSGANQNGRVLTGSNIAMDPEDHFTIQLWAAVHAMAQFPATYDQRYADYARVWVDGSVEAIQVADPDVNTVSFQDPWSYVTWRALHFGTDPGEPGATVGASASVHLATGTVAKEAGIGARAILHLQDLDAARLAAIAKKDTMNTTLLTQQEQQYIDVLQAMRTMTLYFGHGYAQLP